MIRELFSMANSEPDSTDLLTLAADIVAAFVVHNSVPPTNLPELIQTVHTALMKLGATSAGAEPEALVPAVSIRKSITPDYLICLDDGKKFKSLRRHLTALHMTPEQYRTKWGLPESYPMVAANYSATRSAMAKKIGLGQVRKDTAKRMPGRKSKAVDEKAAS
jgi:predicted transcriptional regulator